MTLTAPTRVYPDLRRRGVIYGINTLDPDSGVVELGYVGQTFQRLAVREAQHREDQPWSDLIVEVFVITSGWWTQAEIDEVEEAHIRAWRPLYNYEHNLDNPHRIEVWRAREQRWARDASAGRSAWVPPRPRPRTTGTQVRRGWLFRAWRWWCRRPRRVRRLTWRTLAWLVLVVALWVVSGQLLAGLLGTGVVMVAAHTRRRSGRRRRR